jgi:hypothetical protein
MNSASCASGVRPQVSMMNWMRMLTEDAAGRMYLTSPKTFPEE